MTVKRVTTKAILDKISNPALKLYKGEDYFYFVLDDGVIFDTHSVYVTRLSDLSFDAWVDEGRGFIELVSFLK